MAALKPGLSDVTETSTPFSVKGKSAIVTGAGSGINFSFAKDLLSKGCNVLVADLALRPEAKQLVEEYKEGKDGARAVFLETDVTDWAQLERMFDVAGQAFGEVDVVCPGAGIYEPPWTNFWHPPGTPQSRDAVHGNRYATLDINITHPIRTTQLAIAHFLASSPRVSPTNPKRVIIISSIAGQASSLQTPMYVAAKHAMNGFIRSLGALDARLGIRVNGVAPGIIKTPLWTEHPEKLSLFDEAQDEWATPEEVAEAMVRCLEEEGLGGGTVLEVGAGQTRVVEQFGDPGPSGRGHSVSNLKKSYEEVFEELGESGWGGTRGKV